MHYYELWDTESKTLVATFDDRQAAAEALSEMSSLEGLTLIQRTEFGRTLWIAESIADLECVARDRAPV